MLKYKVIEIAKDGSRDVCKFDDRWTAFKFAEALSENGKTYYVTFFDGSYFDTLREYQNGARI